MLRRTYVVLKFEIIAHTKPSEEDGLVCRDLLFFAEVFPKARGGDSMAGGAIIWINSDKSEQLAYFNNEYVLITITDMKKVSLGDTLEKAKEKLKEIGRYDIYQQLT